MAVRVLILRAPGTNCDRETAHAWRLAGAETETVHVHRLIERPAFVHDFQVLTIPGGFSYGDDIAAARILAARVRPMARHEWRRFLDDGNLILGICNGFQVLVACGLLPDPGAADQTVTLASNACGRFEARWVCLRTGRSPCRFLPPEADLELPVAHAEGRVVCRDASVLQRLIDSRQACLTYVPRAAAVEQGARVEARDLPAATYPDNPNGSAADIAGLTDPAGQVFGLMPHPERFVDATQHPRWARGGVDREPDGLAVFLSALRSFR